jgi:hypothetical protein
MGRCLVDRFGLDDAGIRVLVRDMASLAAMDYNNCKKTDGICEGVCDGEVRTFPQICPFLSCSAPRVFLSADC